MNTPETIFSYLTTRNIPESRFAKDREAWVYAELRHVNRSFAGVIVDRNLVSYQLLVQDQDVVALMGGTDTIWITRKNIFQTPEGAQIALLEKLHEEIRQTEKELQKHKTAYREAALNPPTSRTVA